MPHRNQIRVIVPENRLYFGGDTIFGVTELKVNNKIKCCGIRLIFAGYEYTSWIKTEDNKVSHFKDKKAFLCLKHDFIGTGKEEVIEPGTYRYPFAIALPPIVLPSCRLAHGKIRYKICAYVSDNQNKPDLKHRTKLKVGGSPYNQMDFSSNPKPLEVANETEYSFFNHGVLKMTALAPRTQVFVGEAVPIHVTIENNTNRTIGAVKVSLVTDEAFKCEGNRNREHTVKHIQRFSTKFSGQTNSGVTVEYVIPETTPSMSGSSLVKLYHTLRVTLDVSWASNLAVEIPIHVMRFNPNEPRLLPETEPLQEAYSEPISGIGTGSIRKGKAPRPRSVPSALPPLSLTTVPLSSPSSPSSPSHTPPAFSQMDHLSTSLPSAHIGLPTDSPSGSPRINARSPRLFNPSPQPSPTLPPSLSLSPLGSPRDPVYPVIENFEFPTKLEGVLLPFTPVEEHDLKMLYKKALLS